MPNKVPGVTAMYDWEMLGCAKGQIEYAIHPGRFSLTPVK